MNIVGHASHGKKPVQQGGLGSLAYSFLDADERRLSRFKHKELTEKIIKIFCRVYNKLGYGFLEKIYENAMMIELSKSN